jgi:predicted ribosomally synthesized peptide with SipW-like signal peptide
MKRIAMSLVTIAAVACLVVGATGAYFSSTATVTNNTFSTGTLEIRVNSQPTITGATFSPMAPGQKGGSHFDINNYGPPWFPAGPSNLTAKTLLLSVMNATGDSTLWSNLYIRVQVNRGWPSWQNVYSGPISGLSNADLLHPNWTELIPGSSEDLRYQVWLPETGGDQSALMGKTVHWDFAVEGRTN